MIEISKVLFASINRPLIVISVTLVMREFLDRFPEVSDDAAGSGFKKGLMTAMIPLGAFIGALNMGWLADWISRKRSLMVAVLIFIVDPRFRPQRSTTICSLPGASLAESELGCKFQEIRLHSSKLIPSQKGFRWLCLFISPRSHLQRFAEHFWFSKNCQLSWELLSPFGSRQVDCYTFGFR